MKAIVLSRRCQQKAVSHTSQCMCRVGPALGGVHGQRANALLVVRQRGHGRWLANIPQADRLVVRTRDYLHHTRQVMSAKSTLNREEANPCCCRSLEGC